MLSTVGSSSANISNNAAFDNSGNLVIGPTLLGKYAVGTPGAGQTALPAASGYASYLATVVDCETTSACSTGGGTVVAILRSNGSAWSLYGGAGGGTSVNVNGSSVSNPNFNITTPATETGYLPVKFQVSGSSVSGEVQSATMSPCQTASSLGFALAGSDETTLLNSTLSTFYAAGGGCLYIDAGKTLRADSQIVIPNSGASNYTQPPIRITGAGATGGAGKTAGTVTGSSLDLRYHGSAYANYGNGPKLLTMGQGRLEIDHLTLTAGGTAGGVGGTDCAAYVMTTNTVLYIHDTSFVSQHGDWAGCNIGVILGGTGVPGAGASGAITDCFNGYESSISDNAFLNMGIAVLMQSAVNGSTVARNWIYGGNGTTPVAAAIDIQGYGVNTGGYQSSRSNKIVGNVIEVGGYPTPAASYTCAIRLHNAWFTQIDHNDVYDGGSATYFLCGDSTAAWSNVTRSNYVDSDTIYTNATWSTSNYMPFRTVAFFFDGGGSALSGTTTRCTLVPFGGNINQFSMAADQSGSATVTVKAVAFGSYTGPASATDISNGGESMASVSKQDVALTGWTYAGNKPAAGPLPPNTMVCFSLSSPATITWLSGNIQILEGR